MYERPQLAAECRRLSPLELCLGRISRENRLASQSSVQNWDAAMRLLSVARENILANSEQAAKAQANTSFDSVIRLLR